MTIDLTEPMQRLSGVGGEARGLSRLALGLEPSEILTIAYDVRARIQAGEDILNLTVGDFSSAQFPVPELLSEGVIRAVREGHTNYPPAPGVPECREAIIGMTERRLGIRYPLGSCMVVGGARPAIAGSYLALVNPGDRVVYGLPSWNNNYYATITGAQPVELPTRAEDFFFPRPEDIEPHVRSARLICLNTPQNPTGTVIDAGDLEQICRMVVDENIRRRSAGERELYVMFDQVYWALTFDGVRHRTPIELVPEIGTHAILVDGVSKGYAATGLRVGWALGPPDIIQRMTAILTHIGCWAPRPEQVATAGLLSDDHALDAYLEGMRGAVRKRLGLLDEAVQSFKGEFEVDTIRPQGAIYLSIKLDLAGRKTSDGVVLETDEHIRRHILEHAGVALVPFRCFGVKEQGRWFRASVGVASIEECASVEGRLSRALERLS